MQAPLRRAGAGSRAAVSAAAQRLALEAGSGRRDAQSLGFGGGDNPGQQDRAGPASRKGRFAAMR